jgi:hypothetical protein
MLEIRLGGYASSGHRKLTLPWDMQAVATALIKGRCYPEGELEAETDIIAETILNTLEVGTC